MVESNIIREPNSNPEAGFQTFYVTYPHGYPYLPFKEQNVKGSVKGSVKRCENPSGT